MSNTPIEVRIAARSGHAWQTKVMIRSLDGSHVGRNGEVSLKVRADVTRASGIDATRVFGPVPFSHTTEEVSVGLPEAFYAYEGESLNLRPVAVVTYAGAAPVECAVSTPLSRADAATGADAARLIEPKDAFSFVANLKAIPAKNRVIALLLAGVGSLVAMVNTAVGVHDQFVPESRAYFYDKTGSDGSESPLEKSLYGTGGVGLMIWLALRAQLRRYMTLELDPQRRPRPDERVAARDLVRGKARVPLEGATLRIAACNRELGQYTKREKKSTKTVSFQQPVRAVVIYEQFLPHVPQDTPLESFLDGDVDFSKIGTALYPPCKIGDSHGIDVVWEVQLLHPLFVDQEIAGPALDWNDIAPA